MNIVRADLRPMQFGLRYINGVKYQTLPDTFAKEFF